MTDPTPAPPDLRPAAMQFVASLWRLQKELGQTLEPLLRQQPGVDPRTYFLLKTIQCGFHYPKTISEQLMIPPNLMSRYLEGLHRQGFIERHIDEQDSRRVRLTLTPLAHTTLDGAEDTIYGAVGARLRTLPPAQLTALLSALHTLSDAPPETAPNGAQEPA